MASRNADINLVIRAKTEGDKAIASMADAIDQLVNGAGSGNQQFAEFGRTIAALDKAAAGLVGAQERVGASANKQAAAIHASAAGLVEQQQRADTLRRGLELLAAEADKAFIGPKRDGLGDLIKGAKAELRDAESQISRFGAAYERNLAALQTSRSGILDLRRSLAETADAQATAAAAAELNTQALREQEQAATAVSAIQKRINDLTGVNRPDARGSAAAAADILAQADAEYRLAEARQANINKLREEERQSADLADAEQRRRQFDQTQGISADPRGAQARQSAAAFEEAAAAEDRMEREARDLRESLDPLIGIQRRYNEELERYARLAAAGKLSAEQLAEAQRRAQAKASSEIDNLPGTGGPSKQNAKVSLFGLRPYELSNLGYQVNDVVTQLASGTSLAQTLGQQGGQILQLFPRITSAIVGAFTNPAFIGAAAVVGGIILALKEAADQSERLRSAASETTFRADGGSYDPTKLADAADKLDRIGASAEQATATVKVLLDEGINPDLLDQFGRAAQQTAQRLGTDLPAAAKQVADAFTGGYDAVAEFDNKLNFLTASEREHIRQLFEEGNAQAARTEALAAYSRRSEEAAAKQRGPWSDAAKSLGAAWDALIKFIADSVPIRATIKVLDELANAVKNVGDAIAGALGADAPQAGPAGSVKRIADVQAQIRDLQKTISDYEKAIAGGSPIAGSLQRVVDESKAELARAQASLKKLETGAPDTVSNDPNSAAAKQRTDDLRRISVEDELQRLRDVGQSRILSKAEQARRASLAGEEAARSVADQVVAAAERRRAVAKETAAIERETDARVKQSQAEREREIKQFQSRVIGAEGGTAKNPFSTAKGYGQFTERTFKDQFAKVFPDRAGQLSSEQVLALRNNETVAKAVIDNYARENARFLERFGAKVTAGNLYLAHFLGASGAKAVLTADGATPVDQIIRRLPNGAQSLSGNQGYLRLNNGKGRYRTASELQTFIGGRVSDTGQPQTQGQVAINNLIEQSKQKQDEFNLSIRHGAEDRQRLIDTLQSERGLYGEALIAEQRRQAVAKAELDLRQQVETANKNLADGEPPVVVTQEQVDKAKELAGALFDVQNIRERLNARVASAERPLDELTAQRDLLRDQAEYLRSVGDFNGAEQIDAQVQHLGGSIAEAYDALIQFYQALSPDEQVELGIVDQQQLDNIIAKLRLARDRTEEWGKVAGISSRDIAQAFASQASQSFTNFINKVAAGKNVFKSLGQSIRELAANFIASIAQMIVQLLAFAAIVQVLRAIGVPVPSSGFPITAHHTGGIIGQATGQRRTIGPEIFAGAARFHTGGIVGLTPDEVPIIAKRGEEVLTEGDPRHRNNSLLGTADDGAVQPVNIINTFDREEAAEMLLRTKASERAIMNFITENPRAVRAALNS